MNTQENHIEKSAPNCQQLLFESPYSIDNKNDCNGGNTDKGRRLQIS